jgi:hypothetical protein
MIVVDYSVGGVVAPLAGAGVGDGEVITGPGVVITVPLVVELQPSSHEPHEL